MEIYCNNYEVNIENGLFFNSKSTYVENQNIFISGIINSKIVILSGTNKNIMSKIKRALISLSDKQNLKPLLNCLKKYNIQIISSVEHSKQLKT